MVRLFALLLMVLPMGAIAQGKNKPPAAVLIADEVFISADRELVASGNVEAFQGNVRIEAEEIRYDRVTGALTITGPIRLQDGESVIIVADAAELDAELRAGILNGARVVIDEYLQLTAGQAQRIDDRYSQLHRTAVTSCRVCDDGGPPLWQIRAKRVIHDKEERQLYFDQAQFRILDVPVLYVPRMRLPDPTVERATGFLAPYYRQSSELDFGVKVPYFIALREDRDLLLTPYISPSTTTLEFRYRQAFVNGDVVFDSAISRDDIRKGDTRGYVFGVGKFNLENDYRLRFDVQLTSDDAYLQEYGYSGKDRLRSQLLVSRARRDDYSAVSLINYQSLRDSERNSTIPTVIGDYLYQKRLFPSTTGGELRLTAGVHSHLRYSDDDGDGRDVSRLNVEARWLKAWSLAGGVQAEGSVGMTGDLFNIRQDREYNGTESQVSPFTTLALRYPMTKTESGGATQFLEPLVQLAYTGSSQLDIPNEESTLVDFDDGNLLSLSRFPGPDRRERGLVAAYGVNWSRFAPSGWEGALTLGQVIRDEDEEDFTVSTGLDGTTSDFLVAGQLKTLNGWAVTARTLFNDSFDFTKAEILGAYRHKRGRLSGSYIWFTDDPAEDRFADTSEIFLDGRIKIADNWTAKSDYRYDFEEARASEAGFGLAYFNECVEVNFTVRRRYTRSSSLEPSTAFGLSIGLRGFSAGDGSEAYTKTCG